MQSLIGAQVDGIFGPATEMALKMRQTALGIAVDGIAGPHTWATLLEASTFALPPLQGLSASEARAQVAESQLGVSETRQNRGPQVDRYVREMGGDPTKAYPWCGYFTSWCGRQVHDAGIDIARVTSGAARRHWQDAHPSRQLIRGAIAARVEDGESLRGAVYVRARTSAPHNRAGILDRRRVQGHVGIVTGAHIDRLGRVVLDGIAGNSSGSGHATLRGTGSVAREVIVEGSRAWRALAGVVLP